MAARVVCDMHTTRPEPAGAFTSYELRTVAAEIDDPLDLASLHVEVINPALAEGYYLLGCNPAPGWSSGGCLFYVIMAKNHR